jgi:hypothetical protein
MLYSPQERAYTNTILRNTKATIRGHQRHDDTQYRTASANLNGA